MIDDPSRRGRSRWSRTLEERFGDPADRSDQPSAQPPPRAPGGSEAVLVVEDQDQVREAARAALEGLGYRVRAAATADEALRFVRTGGEVELLLTDIVLPGMNGLTLAERVAGERPDVRILFMSAFASEKSVPTRSLRGQPCAFLEKPFSRDVLARAIRELLDRTS